MSTVLSFRASQADKENIQVLCVEQILVASAMMEQWYFPILCPAN